MAGAAYELDPEHQHLAVQALRAYAEQLRAPGRVPDGEARTALEASAEAAEELADRIDRHLSRLWATHQRR